MELRKGDIITVIDGNHKDHCPLGVINHYLADECIVSILGGRGKGIIHVETKFLILIARDCQLHPFKKLPDSLLKAIQDLAIKATEYERITEPRRRQSARNEAESIGGG